MPSPLPDAVRATLSDEEERRLEALDRTALLDTAPDELFDRYVRIAAALTGTPIALISLVARDRHWFKAGIGMGGEGGIVPREIPRTWSVCDHVIGGTGVFEVEDVRADPRFAQTPPTLGDIQIRFYAGAPLIVSGKQAIGVLSVVSPEPYGLTAAQRGAFADLAQVLSREIETNHLVEIRADRAAAARAAAVEIEHQMRNMFSKVGAIIEMTAREAEDIASLADGARRRIVALSQANEVALRNDFGEAPMAEVAAAALRAVRDRTGVTIEASGDALSLTPAAASVLAPLIDELAHDAARRGALQGPGDAALRWRVEGDEVTLTWTEARPPGPGAYASDYPRRTVPTALRGRTTVSERGYELRVPLDAVAAHEASQGG